MVDRPYNQLPSLHVALCVIFWVSLPLSPWRMALRAWLVLVAVSTLFTWQHHVLDVIAGCALGLATVALIRPDRRIASVALYYLLAAAVVLIAGVLALHVTVLLYVVASLLLVALAYWRQDRQFLHKRSGKLPVTSWLLYAPYLAGYYLTWLCVRWRERARPAFRQVTPQLIVGRRLTGHEARQLPPGCSVIDLANELSETACLRRHPYQHFALADLQPPPPAVVAAIIGALERETAAGRVVYLHCAMGYSRSIFIANLFTSQSAHVADHLPAQTPFSTPA